MAIEQFHKVGTLFNLSSPLAKLIYGRMLRQEYDTNEDMFFSRHGWVERAGKDSMTDAPIHMTTEPNYERGAEFQIVVNWYITGEPQVGANAIARSDARGVPQIEFTFRTTVLYGVPLELPEEHTDRLFTISLTGTYTRQHSQYWSSVMAEWLTVYFTGMRGESETFYIFNKQQGSAANITSAQKASFSESLQALHEVNPISPPQRLHTSWKSNFDVGSAVSPTSATSNDVLKFEDFNLLCVYLDSRTIRREGFAFNMPRTRFRGPREGDMTRGAQYRTGWSMVVLPEVIGDLRKHSSASLWSNHQGDLAGGVGFRQGLNDGNVGEFYGITLLTYNKLPRYWGGSAGDVPIVRCMIPGAQALTMGVRYARLKKEYEIQMNPRMRSLSQLGVPVKAYVVGKNDDRVGELHSKMKAGIAKTRFKRPDTGKMVDKGVFCMDVAYSSAVDYDGSGNILL